jgi:hypothetical protein
LLALEGRYYGLRYTGSNKVILVRARSVGLSSSPISSSTFPIRDVDLVSRKRNYILLYFASPNPNCSVAILLPRLIVLYILRPSITFYSPYTFVTFYINILVLCFPALLYGSTLKMLGITWLPWSVHLKLIDQVDMLATPGCYQVLELVRVCQDPGLGFQTDADFLSVVTHGMSKIETWTETAQY